MTIAAVKGQKNWPSVIWPLNATFPNLYIIWVSAQCWRKAGITDLLWLTMECDMQSPKCYRALATRKHTRGLTRQIPAATHFLKSWKCNNVMQTLTSCSKLSEWERERAQDRRKTVMSGGEDTWVCIIWLHSHKSVAEPEVTFWHNQICSVWNVSIDVKP